jgi:hypothetical protein
VKCIHVCWLRSCVGFHMHGLLKFLCYRLPEVQLERYNAVNVNALFKEFIYTLIGVTLSCNTAM